MVLKKKFGMMAAYRDGVFKAVALADAVKELKTVDDALLDFASVFSG